MRAGRGLARAARWTAAAAALGAAVYGALVGFAWWRFGTPPAPTSDDADALLDRFMPACDIVERHHIEVAAPAAVTFASAGEMDITGPRLIRAIFRARELFMGSAPDVAVRPRAFLSLARSIGWGVLAERPGEEIIWAR